jgi:hypothetical protein
MRDSPALGAEVAHPVSDELLMAQQIVTLNNARMGNP